MAHTVRLSFGAQIVDENGVAKPLADEDLLQTLLPYFTRLADSRRQPPDPPNLLARAMANCHVGPYELRPAGVDELPPAYRKLDPSEFELC